MKRLVSAVASILIMVALAVTGCAGEETVPPEEAEEVVASSCVTCHTDKDILKEVATPEEAEATSEETTGEG